jgi:hypothetical protein
VADAVVGTEEVTAVARAGLRGFTLDKLSAFTHDKSAIPADADHWLFYVGSDDVHGVLLSLHEAFSVSMVGNMFGYDDEALNAAIWDACEDPSIFVRETLDHSQAGGVHEKKILASDVIADPKAFASHFAIIESATGQISHTKGGILDGCVAYEGSTNWSTSGEGTFVTQGQPGGPGYKAQNNTLMVFIDQATIARFRAELDTEFHTAKVYAPAAA